MDENTLDEYNDLLGGLQWFIYDNKLTKHEILDFLSQDLKDN